MSTSRLFF